MDINWAVVNAVLNVVHLVLSVVIIIGGALLLRALYHYMRLCKAFLDQSAKQLGLAAAYFGSTRQATEETKIVAEETKQKVAELAEKATEPNGKRLVETGGTVTLEPGEKIDVQAKAE